MTMFISFRTRDIGGPVGKGVLLQGDGTSDPLDLTGASWDRLQSLIEGRDVAFVTHGFNVDYRHGAYALSMLAAEMALPPSWVFVGLLWPGDSWLPIVDYPFEGGVAMECGGNLAALCNARFAGARSLSFVTHSLGARMALEAVARLDRRQVRIACLTAAAINDDALTAEYADAASRLAVVSVLASRSDRVLQMAYPIGDPISLLLHDDHSLFRAALGYAGPRPRPDTLATPFQIPTASGFGHSDYLPQLGAAGPAASTGPNWARAALFMRQALLGLTQHWPA